MDGNITIGNLTGKIVSIPRIDESLEKKGYAADAKTVGDALESINARINELSSLIEGASGGEGE